MAELRRLLLRLYHVFRPGAAEAELDRELRSHIELLEDEYGRRGLTPEAAHVAARRALGGVDQVKESQREARSVRWADAVRRDFGYALRTLRRAPRFATVVVLTLALGVSANTSVFALVDALLFHPAGGTRPNELVWIAAVQHPSGDVTNVSYPLYQALRDQSTSLAGLLVYSTPRFAVGGRNPSLVNGSIVSGNYFEVLGIRAGHGRLLTPADDQPAAPPAAVLGDGIWHQSFGADPSLVGTSVSINGEPFTIVGIAPPDFRGVEFGERGQQIWVPLSTVSAAMPGSSGLLTDPRSLWLHAVGRVKADRTIAQTQAELSLIAGRTATVSVAGDQRPTIALARASGEGLWSHRSVAFTLGLVSLVPLFVLLVACTNVANAMLARHLGRQREFAMRQALGASRMRLVTQLLAEAAVLATVAAFVGFALSIGLTFLVAKLGDVSAEDTALLLPGPRTVAMTGLVAFLSTLVFGLMPAIRGSRIDPLPILKDETVAATGNRRGRRLRNALIVTQVALSLALLVASGLFVQSLTRILQVNPGFTPSEGVSLSVNPGLQRYSISRRTDLVDRLISGSHAVPGVTAAGVTTLMPLSGITVGGDVSTDRRHRMRVLFSSVTPGFFDAMGVSIVDGRAFTSQDTKGSTPVAMVNQALATRLWPRQRAVGQVLFDGTNSGQALEVVGVIHDMKYEDLAEDGRAVYFVPYAQSVGPQMSPIFLVARTPGDEAGLLRTLTALVKTIDPDMPVSDAGTLSESVRRAAANQQAVVSFLVVFGVLTLLLTAVGIYGVAAHSASLRTREVGIRLALGAGAADIRRLFIGESLVVSAIGVAIGLGLSAAASQLLKRFLYGLSASDAVTFAGGAFLLCVVAVMASYGPARQAARADPIRALRKD